jgi:hypothetical protein
MRALLLIALILLAAGAHGQTAPSSCGDSIRDGACLKEIIVPPPLPNEPAALVPDASIVKTIDAIKSSKKVITGVSIGTPRPANAIEAKLLSLRANYATYILAHNGVARSMITTVEGGAPPEAGLRLRFFGRDQ